MNQPKSFDATSCLYFLGLVLVPQIISIGILGTIFDDFSTDLNILTINNILAAFLSIPFFILFFRQDKFILHYGKISKVELLRLILIGLMMSIAYTVIHSFLDTKGASLYHDLRHSGGISLVIIIVSLCFVSPILEEFTYRGALFSLLKKTSMNTFMIVILVSSAFTALHWQYDLSALAYLFLFSLYLGYIRIKTNNIFVCILVHAINNTYGFFVIAINI